MNRILIYTVLVLAVSLVGIIAFRQWPHRSAHIISPNLASQATPSRDSKNIAQADSLTTGTNTLPDFARISDEQNKWLAKNAGIVPGMTKEQAQEKMLEWYRNQSAKMATQDQHPIVFYGQTVDESNQPVAGVNIHLSLNGGGLEKDLQSDASGSFSFYDAVGKTLVVDVYKDGYYNSKSNRMVFDYTTYQPNLLRPEVFHLQKKGFGSALITSQYGMAKDFPISIQRDGTSVQVNLLTRAFGQDGQLIVSQTKPPYENWKTATAWSFKMEIPDGGFVEENDEFPFEAPESGYKSVIEFKFQQGQPDWTTDVLRDYYIKFGNPPRYGHLHIDTSIDMTGARLTYAINPDGSRNLEPK